MTPEQEIRLMRFFWTLTRAVSCRISTLDNRFSDDNREELANMSDRAFVDAEAMIDELDKPAPPPTLWLLVRKSDGHFLALQPSDGSIIYVDDCFDERVIKRPTKTEAERLAHSINLWKLLEPIEYQPPAMPSARIDSEK